MEIWAADELRSVNGQIEYVLREAVRKRKGSKRERPLLNHASDDQEASQE